MHHSVSRRGGGGLPSPSSYSDRCTVQAANSSSPEIQYECQNATETSSVWLVAGQIGCERGKKSVAKINKHLAVGKREKEIVWTKNRRRKERG